VILGGANAAVAAGLLDSDSLVDGVFVGNDEKTIAALFTTLGACKAAGSDKRATLRTLGTVPGFLVAGETRSLAVRAAVGPEPSAVGVPVDSHEEQMGSGLVAVSDGCPFACSFCLECWTHRPYGERGVEGVLEQALAVKRSLAADSIGLYGYSVNAHRDLGDILVGLCGQGSSLGLKSQRLDWIGREPALLDAFRALDKGSVTVGLEGISSRLRGLLDKQLTIEAARAGMAALFEAKMREVKVFLVITGHERDEDFAEFEEFLAYMNDYRSRCDSSTRVVFSATPLVCFPHTPLEFAPAPSPDICAKTIQRLGHTVWRFRMEYRDAAGAAEQFVSQALARPTDSRTVQAMIAAVLSTSFVYYRDIHPTFAAELRRCLESAGVPVDRVGTPDSVGTAAPWQAVDLGVKRTALFERFQRCMRALEGTDDGVDRAGSDRAHAVSTTHVTKITRKLQARRAGRIEVAIAVNVGPRGSGVPRRMVGLAVAQSLMAACPSLAPHWDGYLRSLWSEDDEPCVVAGEDVLVTAWQREALGELSRLCAEPALLPLDPSWCTVLRRGDTMPVRQALLRFRSPFDQRIDRFLEQAHLAATRRKTGERHYEWVLNKQSLKKDVVRSILVTGDESGGCEVTVQTGKRFDTGTFLAHSFDLPLAADGARVEVRAELL
jgi:hypothetical protein